MIDLNNKEVEKLEEELIHLIENELTIYIDECDLDQDRWIDFNDFANYAKKNIEDNVGIYKFDDFNILSYAKFYAESYTENLVARHMGE